MTKLVFPKAGEPPEEDPLQAEYNKRLKKIDEWEVQKLEILSKALEEQEIMRLKLEEEAELMQAKALEEQERIKREAEEKMKMLKEQ